MICKKAKDKLKQLNLLREKNYEIWAKEKPYWDEKICPHCGSKNIKTKKYRSIDKKCEDCGANTIIDFDKE